MKSEYDTNVKNCSYLLEKEKESNVSKPPGEGNEIPESKIAKVPGGGGDCGSIPSQTFRILEVSK